MDSFDKEMLKKFMLMKKGNYTFCIGDLAYFESLILGVFN